ncbi:MAG: hypothetical protein WA419_11950 [Silvibacterium sp.]
MPQEGNNQGVIVSGGSFTATNVATGTGAAIHTSAAASSPELDAVREQLAALMKALDDHAQALQNPAEVKQSAQVIAEELKKPKPNRITLNGVLGGIAQSVKSVSVLATAAEALKIALAALFA